ncbi:MAG TPA: hydrogenase iron-sulfur subunit [Firmicutes bacterium]|nr:hydrogenase iron-sulfur subunit [Bacillota bacterium]
MSSPSVIKKGILLYYCRLISPETVVSYGTQKAIEVPCSGRVGVGELMKGLASGYEKIIVLSCGEKSCIHKFGCTEAKKAFETAKKLAQTAGADSRKLEFIEMDTLSDKD